MKARLSLAALTEVIASVQRDQQRLTVSVYIPHKENLVKLWLTYFTAVVRAPEEYIVRRNGFNLFLSNFMQRERTLLNWGVSRNLVL